MKKWIAILVATTACGPKGLVTGDYDVSYGEAMYGASPLNLYIDSDSNSFSAEFEETLSASECSPVFQEFTAPTKLSLDAERPTVTDPSAEESPFAIGNSNCSYDSYDGKFSSGGTDENVIACANDEIIVPVTVDDNGTERSIDVTYTQLWSIQWDTSLQRVIGFIDISPDSDLNEDDALLVDAAVNLECRYLRLMDLELSE